MGAIIKALSNSKPRMSQNFIGAPSFRHRNPALYDFYCDDRYASIFPSVKAIAQEFMTIRPYTINNKKESVPSPVRNALYHPNQLDSSVSFFEKLAVMNLTSRNTYLLVWRREGKEAKAGGDITPANIAGFTFLENPAIETRDNRTYYKMGAQEFSDMEVITIPGGVDPSGLYKGYAPGIGSAQWATLDDFIADYQKGFFRNGGIPSGLFTVVANTTQEYNDIVDEIEKRHGGAGNNNKPTFAHAPMGADGKPVQAQITWTPMQQSNKEIDFKNLFEQANNRIDSAFGVPASIRGVGQNNNYATAKTDQQNFIRFSVNPLALRIYTQITHELNRITGGPGVAITFKLELPAIADEEKVLEETKQIRDNRVLALESRGYTLESIKAYFQTGDIEALVKNVEPASEDDDVDDGNEVTSSPDPAKIDGVGPLNKKKDKKPKAELSESDVEQYEQQLSIVITDHMEKQIEDFISSLDAQNAEGDPTEQDTESFTDDMMVVIVAVLVAAGLIQYLKGTGMLVAAGVSVDELTSFALTDIQQKAYRDYLVNIARSYGDDTGAAIRSVLDRANVEGWPRVELERNLRNIMNTDQWRVKRLATSEINRSQDMGSVYSMRQIQEESGASIERSLLHTGSDVPCEYCQAYIGNWSPIDDVMIKKDEVIEGVDGGLLVYTWDNNEGHDVHANGHCVPQFRVKK